MNQAEVLLPLFWRESHEELRELKNIDETVQACDRYEAWLDKKRQLTLCDIQETHWIKSCTGGYITEVVFNADGTLEEYRLFDRFPTQGHWQLHDGTLDVEIYKADNCYTFAVVGCQAVNIHSAIEYKNGELHSYLKLAQVKPN
ncbi:hypothetical protein F0224_16040 [Vibrio coralliilyticus]|uniref:hypothetical protein n=1 Tax=Vibrio coralliilyticus TaxID=190893 RepID=UPI000BAC1961|nr:hypothetical protein [Vibrio coralliilyticus]NOI77198.1 hypothetical protein [Vibrio coralliilyticus]PAW03207.1 hypothetical protein CKJ79_13550 [Vibrio coralliilyticus]